MGRYRHSWLPERCCVTGLVAVARIWPYTDKAQQSHTRSHQIKDEVLFRSVYGFFHEWKYIGVTKNVGNQEDKKNKHGGA